MVKVLVVDDFAFIRQVIRTNLVKLGLPAEGIYEASNGLLAAKQAVELGSLDLLISDVNMPHMDGITLAEKLKARQRFAKTQMVMVVENLSPKGLSRIQALGITAIVRKPFNSAQFNMVVKPVLSELGVVSPLPPTPEMPLEDPEHHVDLVHGIDAVLFDRVCQGGLVRITTEEGAVKLFFKEAVVVMEYGPGALPEWLYRLSLRGEVHKETVQISGNHHRFSLAIPEILERGTLYIQEM